MNRRPLVLVVDDEPINIDILYETLHRHYRVQASLEGDLALDIIERDRPDLVLLDVRMPGTDGYEVLDRINERWGLKEIPVIFLTGRDTQVEEARGLAMGACDYITKPFHPDTVLARVGVQMALKEHRDMLQKALIKTRDELVRHQEATIETMSYMSVLRDAETGAHIQRTKKYMQVLGDALAQRYPKTLSPEEVELAVLAAPLHDVGKVGISDLILQKPGRLTVKEFEIMKTHTTIGVDILKSAVAATGKNPVLLKGIELSAYHHERWDGTGYPFGLKRGKIPMAARIMHLVDVYDALVSKRPYKEAFSHEKAVAVILKGDDRTRPEHFWPAVLNAFETVHESMRRIHESMED